MVLNCPFQESHAVEKRHGVPPHWQHGHVRSASALANFMNQTFTNWS